MLSFEERYSEDLVASRVDSNTKTSVKVDSGLVYFRRDSLRPHVSASYINRTKTFEVYCN